MATALGRKTNITSITSDLSGKWGLWIALGVLWIVLGLIAFANLLWATVVSVYTAGFVMLIGGIAQIIHALSLKSWRRFFLWMASGLIYSAAGVAAFYNPVLAAAALTLALASILIISGIVRIAAGLQFRHDGAWSWIVASGVMTTLVGVIFLVGWPVNTLYLLGLVLAIDLVFQGISAIGFGFAIKRLQ
jgi:uncharacterized membrane protein HdeD (DUF308 family)